MTVAVWGEAFVELFLEFVLPSYLAPGVIPEVPRRGYGASFRLYTTSCWVETIRAHGSYRRLAQIVETRIVAIDERVDLSGHSSPYETMNACHLDFIAEAEREGAAMIFFSPDAFWSTGSLRFTLDQVERGARAVLMAGVRADKSPVLAELAPEQSSIEAGSLTGRRLIGLLVRHPHTITRSLEWGAREFDIGWPSHVYWRVGTMGWLGRCFHLHTFYVHPRHAARPDVAHDYDWLARIGLGPGEVHVVDDSDQVCALELSPSDRGINGRIGPATLLAMADWARRHAQPDHCRYVRHAIRFHADAGRGWRWLARRVASAAWVRSVLVLARVLERIGLEHHPDGRWLWHDGGPPPGAGRLAHLGHAVTRVLVGRAPKSSKSA